MKEKNKFWWKLGFILFLFFLPRNSNAQILWEVSGRNLDKPSYLFGSIHMICPEDFIWTDQMQMALDKTTVLCLETNINTNLDLSVIIDTTKKFESYFRPSDYKRLAESSLNKFHIDFNYFTNFKPAIVRTILSSKFTNCLPISYEMKILEKSKYKYLDSLESQDEQIYTINKINSQSIINEIKLMLDSTTTYANTYKSIIKNYREQNIKELYNEEFKSKESNFLVTERNIRWLNRIKIKMSQQPTFFVVGVAHLWGTKGLIYLLRKQGYTLKPIINDNFSCTH